MRGHVIGGLLLALTPAAVALAQSSVDGLMPNGWRDLPAEDLLAASRDAFASSGVTRAEREVIAEHVWQTFFGDPQFALAEKLPVVVGMVETFGRLQPAIDAATVVDFRDRVDARLAGESESLSGIDLFELESSVEALAENIGPWPAHVPLFLRWKDANDWRSLETRYVYNLFSLINVDAIDRRKFSARWTGFLTAPRDGEYVFEQARVYRGDDSRLRLWLDGAVVLDSTGGDADSFTSKPIRLPGGRPVALRAELVHETAVIEYSDSAPMALVTWRTPGRGAALIPSSALSSEERGEPGLSAAYYADTAFSGLRVERVDPSLDMVWSWPPAAPQETEASHEVFAEIVRRVLDDAYLNRIAEADDATVAVEFDRNLWRIAYRMSAAERQQLIAVLRRNPKVLARLSPEAIGRLFRGIYMLPGGEKLDLIGEWSLARPQPRCRPGWYPGWGDGGYQKLNTDFYWAIGHMMQGPYAELAEQLCDAYLVRQNGDCNLHVLYAAAFAGDQRSMRDELLTRIQSRLEGESLTADQRVTWLIARAFLEETPSRQGRPRPLRGRDSLVEAIETAGSDPYRAWAVEELLARLQSVEYFDRARELINQHSSLLSSARSSRSAAAWRSDADRLEALVQQRQSDSRAEAERLYEEEVRRRRSSVR